MEKISDKTLKAGARGISLIIKHVRTPLILAALSLFLILAMAYTSISQSQSKSDILIVSIIALSFILTGFIVYVGFKLHKIKLDDIDSEPQKDNSIADYEIPSNLIVYTFKSFDSQGNYRLNILRVSTLNFLVDGDVNVVTTRRDTNIIAESKSISNPLEYSSFGEGTPKGGSVTEYKDVKSGQYEILVMESVRNHKIGIQSPPPPDDILLKTLYANLLKTKYYEFVGTRFLAPTRNNRLLLYFPKKYLPKTINAVVVNRNGKILRRCIQSKLVEDKNLWIFECHKPDLFSGFYAYWKWKENQYVD